MRLGTDMQTSLRSSLRSFTDASLAHCCVLSSEVLAPFTKFSTIQVLKLFQIQMNVTRQIRFWTWLGEKC